MGFDSVVTRSSSWMDGSVSSIRSSDDPPLRYPAGAHPARSSHLGTFPLARWVPARRAVRIFPGRCRRGDPAAPTARSSGSTRPRPRRRSPPASDPSRGLARPLRQARSTSVAFGHRSIAFIARRGRDDQLRLSATTIERDIGSRVPVAEPPTQCLGHASGRAARQIVSSGVSAISASMPRQPARTYVLRIALPRGEHELGSSRARERAPQREPAAILIRSDNGARQCRERGRSPHWRGHVLAPDHATQRGHGRETGSGHSWWC